MLYRSRSFASPPSLARPPPLPGEVARGGTGRRASPSSVPPRGQPRARGRGAAAFRRFFSPEPGLQTESVGSTVPQPRRFYYSCDSAPPFMTQVLSWTLQPSGAASWEADGRLREEASYLLRNCLCGILTIWKEYGNETFSEMELLS